MGNMGKAAVVGLGYVGLPFLAEMAERGFDAIGVDVSAEKCARVNAGDSYIEDVSSERLKRLLATGRLRATTDYAALAEAEAISVCVPTPLSKSREPDISYILAALESLLPALREGQILILESTTYPGTTEEILRPALEAKGFRVGETIFLAFSPERVDPGNQRWTLANTPKVLGGSTPACLQRASVHYRQIFEQVVEVSSTRAAEMVKLLENTFRAVNIGLVNETALICHRLGLDVWEIIHAASTKPFGFMPFLPGPGLGGHCIPVDPRYLAWKMKAAHGYSTRFIELAEEVNASMPRHVVERVQSMLNDVAKPLNGSRVVVLGAAYKKNVSDTRVSPALDVIRLLRRGKARVFLCDPHVEAVEEDGERFESLPVTPELLRGCDIAVIITQHDAFDWGMILANAPMLFDARDAAKGRESEAKGRLEKL
jgi:UDP-N-acetyl-D-glucosamine dehydrogenase